jgi:hypothetical protein
VTSGHLAQVQATRAEVGVQATALGVQATICGKETLLQAAATVREGSYPNQRTHFNSIPIIQQFIAWMGGVFSSKAFQAALESTRLFFAVSMSRQITRWQALHRPFASRGLDSFSPALIGATQSAAVLLQMFLYRYPATLATRHLRICTVYIRSLEVCS